MVDSTGKFVKDQLTNIGDSVDIIRIREVYDQISHIAGESILEKLKHRFIIAPASTLFAQGFTDESLYKLTYHDIETSWQMFQLLLDIIPSDTEYVYTHA